jgi:hypothetical protein
MDMKAKLRKAVEYRFLVCDANAKSGEFTLKLRENMKEFAKIAWNEDLDPLLDIFDKEGFEPYRKYYEVKLEGNYIHDDNWIVLAHTKSGKYLLGSY